MGQAMESRVEARTGRALDVLAAEHHAIRSMMEVLAAAVARLDRGGHVPVALFADAVEFFSRFADATHHHKEERRLLPLLRRHGLGDDTAVVAALIAQHEIGRVYVQGMSAARGGLACGDPAAREAFVCVARAYLDLLREHIRIEEEYFYPLAAAVLTAGEDETLAGEFECAAPYERCEKRRYIQMIRHYREMIAGWQTS